MNESRMNETQIMHTTEPELSDAERYSAGCWAFMQNMARHGGHRCCFSMFDNVDKTKPASVLRCICGFEFRREGFGCVQLSDHVRDADIPPTLPASEALLDQLSREQLALLTRGHRAHPFAQDVFRDQGRDDVADGPENRERRAALMANLPGRVIVPPEPEELLNAGPPPVFPGFALRWLLALLVLGALAYCK